MSTWPVTWPLCLSRSSSEMAALYVDTVAIGFPDLYGDGNVDYTCMYVHYTDRFKINETLCTGLLVIMIPSMQDISCKFHEYTLIKYFMIYFSLLIQSKRSKAVTYFSVFAWPCNIIAILTQYREFSPRSRNESGNTSRPVGPTKEVQPRFISTFISGPRAKLCNKIKFS